MPVRLGIGVITYNRRQIVLETVDRVLAHTNQPFAFVVADDGSEDGTADHLRDNNIVVASGSNMGIAWNKNRALFYLLAFSGARLRSCSRTIRSRTATAGSWLG